MTWRWMGFRDGTKGHMAPADLAAAILDDLVSRGAKPIRSPEDRVDQRYLFIDLPGMGFPERVRVELDGLVIETQPHHVPELVRYLLRADARRTADGRPYYKVHGFGRCLVLHPGQRFLLLRLWRNTMPTEDRIVTA